MKKIADAAVVAALLMLACADPLPTDLPDAPPAQVAEVSHGDRPC